MGRELTPNRFASFTSVSCGTVVLCGISTCFQVLSPCLGQIAHALLTRPPLEHNLPFRRTSNYVPARLACVKHAASVRPEPGSNSDVQSLSCFAVPRLMLAKALAVPPQTKRLLSQKSDCSFSLDLLRCIVFKDRCCRLNRCSRDNVDDYIKVPYTCQPLFSTFFVFNTKPDFPSKFDGFQPDSSRIGWICRPRRARFALSGSSSKRATAEAGFFSGSSWRKGTK